MSIDPRLIDRRKTVAEDNAKRSVSRLLKFLMVVLVAGAGVWLVFSPWLSVSLVTATGIATSDGHSVLADEGVRAGTPMILISAGEVEAALLDDPWVSEASVRLDWPDRVVVEVAERSPVAWVKTGEGWTRRAIDGVSLPSGPKPGEGMARVEMATVPDRDAEKSPDLLGALEFVAALPPDLHEGTVVSRENEELWATVSGFRVRLGRSVEMAEKAVSLDALLSEGIAEGSTLILIAPTNPAVMGPSGDDATTGDEDPSGSEGEDGGEDGTTGDTNDDS
jgi:cell division protein FtsQ